MSLTSSGLLDMRMTPRDTKLTLQQKIAGEMSPQIPEWSQPQFRPGGFSTLSQSQVFPCGATEPGNAGGTSSGAAWGVEQGLRAPEVLGVPKSAGSKCWGEGSHYWGAESHSAETQFWGAETQFWAVGYQCRVSVLGCRVPDRVGCPFFGYQVLVLVHCAGSWLLWSLPSATRTPGIKKKKKKRM